MVAAWFGRSREVWLAMTAAFVLGGAIVAFGPPGVDVAAHAYLRDRFLVEGFSFWDNYWYAGRYELINYSLLFYPLAALIGETVVALGSVVAGAGLFAALVVREWGHPARWSARLFAVLWPTLLLAGQYPFALGTVLALAALLCVQRDRPWLVVLASLGALLASPLAFLLLGVALMGLALANRDSRLLGSFRVAGPLAAILVLALAELLVFRAFPAGGDFPFPALDLAGITLFSLCGLAFARGSERTRVLSGLFLAYLAIGWAAKVYPSALGGNVTRLVTYLSAPLLLLVIALRGFRPRFAATVALGVALIWQVAPLVRNAMGSYGDAAHAATFWRMPVQFFGEASRHNDPNYRVEVVATWGHWESYYLARRGIPIVRGWFRQDDFPQNELFYRGELDAASYQGWLRDMGVRYVALPDAKLDASAAAEARLLRSGRSGLTVASAGGPGDGWTIYELPDPTPILTAPPGTPASKANQAKVVDFHSDGLAVYAPVEGSYRLRVRYTPYWRVVDGPDVACVRRGPRGMSELVVTKPGFVRVRFDVSLGSAANAVGGSGPTCLVPPVAPAS